MKPEDHIFEQVEGYLNNKLSAEEKLAFEKTLETDPDLSQKVKVHELANDMVLEQRLLAVNQNLLNYHKSKGGWSKTTKIGLTVALVAAGTGVFFYLQNTTTPQPQISVQKTESTKSPTTVQQPVQDAKPTDHAEIKTSEKSQIAVQKPEEKTSTETSSEIAPKVITEQQVISPQKEIVTPKQEAKTVQKQPETTPIVAEVPKDRCAGIQILASVAQKPSCIGESNGSVWLNESKGGKAPYTLQVLDQDKQVVSTQHMEAGNYEVVVKDAHGCIGTQKISVSSKICDKDYIINAFAGEELEIPAHNTGGTLKIFDRQGNVYATIQAQPHTKVVWNGQSKNGELNEGFYNFVLEYTDNMTAKGTITIVR